MVQFVLEDLFSHLLRVSSYFGIFKMTVINVLMLIYRHFDQFDGEIQHDVIVVVLNM